MSADRHAHNIGPITGPGTRDRIRQGSDAFGDDLYEVLLQETREFTDNLEIKIRVIRWKLPKQKTTD